MGFSKKTSFNIAKIASLALGFHVSILFGQTLDTLWTKTYGGPGDDKAYCVRETFDGGYIIVGETRSFGNRADIYLIKTDEKGDTIWTKIIGGQFGDGGRSVQQTSDGGYVIAGYTHSFAVDYRYPDLYLVKTDARGDTIWTKTYGRKRDEHGNAVHVCHDGGYIIAGYTSSYNNGWDFYIMKSTANGDSIWTKVYGKTDNDMCFSAHEDFNGDCIFIGHTRQPVFEGDYFPYPDIYFVKTNSDGDTIWTKLYGGYGVEKGFSAQQTSDGGYIIAGFGGSGWGDDDDVILIKTNKDGDMLWTKKYGGTKQDWGYSVKETADGSYVIAGLTEPSKDNYDVWLLKVDENGDTITTMSCGGPGNDRAVFIQETYEGGYIAAGYTTSFGEGDYDIYLIKTKPASVPNIVFFSFGLSHYNLTPKMNLPTISIAGEIALSSFIKLRISGRHCFARRNLSLVAQPSAADSVAFEELYDFSISALGVSCPWSLKIYCGIGASLHYYSLTRYGDRRIIEDLGLTVGDDRDVAPTLIFLTGYETLQNLFPLRLEVSAELDFKRSLSRRFINVGLTFCIF
jgi:hypothetical protein